MLSTIFTEAEKLLATHQKIDRFASRYQVFPVTEAGHVLAGYRKLSEQIEHVPNPTSRRLHLGNELKRRLTSEATSLDFTLSGKRYSIQDVVRVLGIDQNDIDRLHPWLLENRDQTIEATQRLFNLSATDTYFLPVPMDIPDYARSAETSAKIAINNLHKILAPYYASKTEAGNFLQKIEAQPTTNWRSYFHTHLATLGLGIPEIIYVLPNGTFHVRYVNAIALYGHESLGHGLQKVLTEEADLPYFLKVPGSNATIAAEEAVTQHYERTIFEDLRSPDAAKVLKDLDISHSYEEIYQEHGATKQIADFSLAFFQYAITILADKELGSDPQDKGTIDRKIAKLNEVALFPGISQQIVDQNRFKFDPEGNLDTSLVTELRYCSQVVSKALDIFSQRGVSYDDARSRSRIDMAFLRGWYTPEGFLENATLSAKGI